MSSEDAHKLLIMLGYEAQNRNSSHLTYSNNKAQRLITIIQNQKELKKPYVRDLQIALEDAGY